MQPPKVFDLSTRVAERIEAARGPDFRPYERAPVDWEAWEERGSVPRRAWALDEWVGQGYVTLLSGSGGIGKSIVAQQMATAVALGQEFIALVDTARVTLCWMGEDDERELAQRQFAICRRFGVAIGTLRGRLQMEAMDRVDCTLLDYVQGSLARTSMLTELREQVGDYRAELVVLDNIGRLFAGNENDRHHVTSFFAALNWAAAPTGAAVILIGHTSKAPGSEFSGSTAWENACRGRLWFGDHKPDEKVEEGEDDNPDPEDLRYLAKRKVNYTARDLAVLRYEDGSYYVRDAPLGRSNVDDSARRKQAERATLDGFRKLIAMGSIVSDARAAPNYLPRSITSFGLAQNFTKREIEGAMRSLMLDGKLKRCQVGTYANRTPRFGLQEVV